jgi:hypothetical protein
MLLGVISDWWGFEASAKKNKKSYIFAIKGQRGGGIWLRVEQSGRQECRPYRNVLLEIEAFLLDTTPDIF